MFKITYEFIMQGMSRRGGWSDAQIALLDSVKLKGWIRRAIGKEIPESDARAFLALKDEHLKKGRKKKRPPARQILYPTLTVKEFQHLYDIFADKGLDHAEGMAMVIREYLSLVNERPKTLRP